MKFLTLTVLCCFCAAALFSQPGTLDGSFGKAGKVITDLSGGFDFLNTAAIQADGKIVVAGSSGDSLAIGRYLVNGNPDATFGSNGFIKAGYGPTGVFGELKAVLIQPDGKILAGGSWSGYFGLTFFILSRYNSDGKPDETFGNGGVVKLNLNQISVKSLALQQDGKVIVGAANGLSFYVYLFLANGTIDSSFGTDGRAPSFYIGNSNGCYTAVQDDGNIVAAYTDYSNIGLVRYKPNGALDSTFGTDGRSVTDMSGADDRAYSILLQPDEKIVISGGFNYDFANTSFSLARFKTNGTLDSSFGNNGKASASLPGTVNIAYAATLQPDGKIIAAGEMNNHFALARFKSTGMLDSSFGAFGKIVTEFGTVSDRAYKVLLQPDGKIIGAGINYQDNSNSDFALARYNNNTNFPVTNIQTGLWSNPATWSNSLVPGENSVIELGFDVTVDINAKCKSIKTSNHAVHVNKNTGFVITGVTR